MKIKKTPVGQNILDGLGDTENSYEMIQDFLPIIGEIVVAFNALEASLDSLLCETFSDRSDQKGLLVLHSMMYSTKVDLFKKFNDDFIRGFGWDIKEYKPLISSLKECGVLRNKVVHANWEYTDEDGYTQVKFKVGNDGLEHELCQFSVESLDAIVEKIYQTRHALSDFDQECSYKISEWNQQIHDRNELRNRSE
ncbi:MULTISPECIES: hypothetical protein [Vibrio]|uniref:hypothetical protein n=1 Tax=Vibrio TaxID=662 RepID=UPI0003A5EA1B|nr:MULTISPECIES: hypothetical protein [Vibrio]EKO3390423.1 hypothetical protein [Vibrio fluvialis]EKO3427622.1 hypothetical protein [Vibrio fluvialis]MBH9742200.1 hypothetical protein [Vibrio navarrensis]MBY7704235.1 hypothetical protein [Vibrio harveyi]MCG6280277.1 hypothetical protein [Vibrio diabolicus]